jgi:hypothetical protein
MIDCKMCRRFRGWDTLCCDGMDYPSRELGSCVHFIRSPVMRGDDGVLVGGI